MFILILSVLLILRMVIYLPAVETALNKSVIFELNFIVLFITVDYR